MEHLNSKNLAAAGKTGGFSLIEILAVLTIISLLLSMSVIGINSITDSTDLTSSGDQIVNQLVQARQRALADNAHVEVRIYPPLVGSSTKQWIMVLARQGLEASPEILQQPLILSESIAISENKAFSTLIALREMQQDETLMRTPSGIERDFFSFKFHPNGSTNLPLVPNGDTWHLTAISRKFIERNPDALPNNFYTIRVDPHSGSVRSFRP